MSMLRLTNEIFIKKSNLIHDNKYDYSLTEYKNNKKKIEIICPIHGIFLQRPDMHLVGQGCPECKKVTLSNYRKYTSLDIIKKFKKIHSDRYIYDNICYVGYDEYVNITCKKHGNFKQTPHRHICGMGCRKCADDILRKTKEEFIKESSIIHYDKYDYSLVEYINNKSEVNIVCPIHGSFNKKPLNHIVGKEGCPKCKMSQYELIVLEWLKINKIQYICQKKFDDCVYKKKLKFDFYLPEKNTCIEVDGIHHRIPISFFGGSKEFLRLIEKDEIKDKYCADNKINLIRINTDYDIISVLKRNFHLS